MRIKQGDGTMYEIVDCTFKGVGDCLRLGVLLQIFRELIDKYDALE